MSSVLKHFQRRRKESSKFLFTASIQSLKLECAEKIKWEPNNIVILCAQGKRKRHTKPVSWQPGIVNPRRGTIVWTEPDPIETKIALYKDSKREGLFEEENWNFVVQNESRGGRHRSLAAGSVNLADYISEDGKAFDVTVTLKVTDKKIKSGSIDFVLSCSLLGDDGAVCSSYNSIKDVEPTKRPPSSRKAPYDVNKDSAPIKRPRRRAPPPPVPKPKKLDIKDEKADKDYPDSLNPFASNDEDELVASPTDAVSQNGPAKTLDIKDERDRTDYPERLNPFGCNSQVELATSSTDPVDNDKECGSPEKRDVNDKKDKKSYPSTLNPFDSDFEEDLAPPPQPSGASCAELASLQQELAAMNALSSRLEGQMLQAGCKGLTEEQDTLMQEWCNLVKLRTGLMKREIDLKLRNKMAAPSCH